MELISRPVPFPEQAAPEQLAFFSPMLLGLRPLSSHNVPMEALPVFDVNPSLLISGTAPLQQFAHLPFMSWSTTEPALPLNPYTCLQTDVEETSFNGSYVCQEYNALESVDHTLAFEEISNIGNVYENLLESSFCMNATPSNSTDALAAMAQSDALLMHKLVTNDYFSWPLLESTYQFFPSHYTNHAIPSFQGSSCRPSLNLQQETTQYISNIGCSHSSTRMHFMFPLPSQTLDSELGADLHIKRDPEQDKLAPCLTSDNQVQQYFAEARTEAKFSQWMQHDVNPFFSNFQAECIPQANSTGSVVSSSVLTDADTESSVHSERPLASQFVKRHLQSQDSSEKPFTSSWGSTMFKEFSDHSEPIKSFVSADLKTLGSSLANLAPPVKRKKCCFAMETVSKSVDRHSRNNYSQKLEGESSVMKRYSCQPGSESSDELTKPQYRENFLRQQGTGRSNLSPTTESDKRNPQQKPCLTSIEPQSMAARQRRKKISERVRTLEALVPGGNKLDTASMLDEAIKYVKFLQLQIQILESLANENNSAHIQARENSCPDNIYTSGSGMQSVTVMPRPPTSPLVLTEVLQHQLFKSGYCLMSVQQCGPSSSSRAP
ncbi:hypothetical protein O6H91_07G071500 [Diphasiastrum complanatum]|uniref:Uncharacterized protein n=1 Tax=Diphasiastrum complanatum TaxID=34168 RepID=A0ACC2D6E3_DIPCM|nr:hypothetical protein O6H91_07G071500 [Diphasiastrum complanatum]